MQRQPRVTGRKGAVEKEPNARGGDLVPHETREEHQLKSQDPYQKPVVIDLEQLVAELDMHFVPHLPQLLELCSILQELIHWGEDISLLVEKLFLMQLAELEIKQVVRRVVHEDRVTVKSQ
jgi:hypothetical protein